MLTDTLMIESFTPVEGVYAGRPRVSGRSLTVPEAAA